MTIAACTGTSGGVDLALVQATGVGEELQKGVIWGEKDSCLVVSSRFLALLARPVQFFRGEANRLPSVRSGTFFGSALGKCRLQTRW